MSFSIRVRVIAVALSILIGSTAAVFAAEPAPEVQRAPYPPKAKGEVHTIRIIPETCTYLHGMFTGENAVPYRYGAKRTSTRCQPRAQLVDPTKAAPSAASGWILNDIVRIPSAACPKQMAVIRVWRKPADNTRRRPTRKGAREFIWATRKSAQSRANSRRSRNSQRCLRSKGRVARKV